MADIKQIEPGVYKLSKPIVNPKPDRRSNTWENRPEFDKGVYIVRRYFGFEPTESRNPLVVLRACTRDYDRIEEPHANEDDKRIVERWNVLLTALEPAPEAMETAEWMQLNHIESYYANTILDELIVAKKITFDDMKAAWDTYSKRE